MSGARVYVCALSKVAQTVHESNAGSLITLLTAGSVIERPDMIAPERHLVLSLSDIDAPREGHITPARAHVDRLLDFFDAWDRAAPLVIHCYAGVSRSPAAAYIALCALAPDRCETTLAQELRRQQVEPLGLAMCFDHRRILATAMGRLRAKMKYRPVIFELMGDTFTLTELQRTVEAISGRHLHKQNFRRLVEGSEIVEPTGETTHLTGGRPAALFKFRRNVLLERPSFGLKVGLRG